MNILSPYRKNKHDVSRVKIALLGVICATTVALAPLSTASALVTTQFPYYWPTYATYSTVQHYCTVTSMTPTSIDYDGSGTYELKVSITDNQSSYAADGIFLNDYANDITIQRAYVITPAGYTYNSTMLSYGAQSGTTQTFYVYDNSLTSWTNGTTATWVVDFTENAAAQNGQPFAISVKLSGVSGGEMCTMPDGSASYWQNSIFANASSGSGSTNNGTVDFTQLEGWLHTELLYFISGGIAGGIALWTIWQFRFRGRQT